MVVVAARPTAGAVTVVRAFGGVATDGECGEDDRCGHESFHDALTIKVARLRGGLGSDSERFPGAS